MSQKYPEYQQLNQPQLEKNILEKWKRENTFQQSIDLRDEKKPFVFYEGPPSANGMPGIHHVISRTIKDMFCRYKTQQGFQVRRKAGWDTHGLPVELGVEKSLSITKEDIGKKISVEEYNNKCKEAVLQFKDKWEDLTEKMGYWVNMQEPYITYQTEYVESLWWCLKQLYDKKLLYKSVSIQPYSPAAGTGLSSHELNQPGTYKNVKDTSIIAQFKLAALSQQKNAKAKNNAQKILNIVEQHDTTNQDEIYFLAWTTTPWTLPSNLGLTLGAKIIYALVQTLNPYTFKIGYYILAQDLIKKYFKPEGENQDIFNYQADQKILPWKVLQTFTGADLEYIQYEQLFPYTLPESGEPFKVMIGDFVTTEDGTGIVHTAPAFGADDYRVAQKYNIGILTLVDREGKFTNNVGEFSGRYVKNYKDEKDFVDVNVDIAIKLKKENRAFKVEKYEHNYPHCWRTDKPILYYPLDAWFIKTTAKRDKMVELNKTINWKPASTGTGRFGNWLENMVDWNLSRSRYWGTPLPIWKTKDGKEEMCIGSVDELMSEIAKAKEWNSEALIEKIKTDLHKPFVDDIILKSASGQQMFREPDLIDVWFDSGAMPYAQWHYPFANKDIFKNNFPADYICEGVDQTRGWFYTLHALAVMLFDSVAFKTVVSNGLVLDKNGNKMSKRLGNVINPFETIDKYGADATRWYLITNASPWDNMKFDIAGIQEVQRKFFGTLYNTYQFFALYANVDGFSFKEKTIPINERAEIDQWIISTLNTLIKDVNNFMDAYEATEAYRKIEYFLDEQLSNWYVRLCRRRFWKGEYEQDKIAAYQTLYECLDVIAQLIAPIAPFFSEWLFNNLNQTTHKYSVASVHHSLFPQANEKHINKALEEKMAMAQITSSLVLSLRKAANIKVRQPLQKILIPVFDEQTKHYIASVQDIILAETNIKQIDFINPNDGFIQKNIKPNFILLGKKLGAKMKAVSDALTNFTQAQIQEIEQKKSINLNIQNETINLLLEEVEIKAKDIPGWMVANKDTITVALDITVTHDLENEGNAREFVNRIQKIRKEQNFNLTDKIHVLVEPNSSIETSLLQFKTYICTELLATDLSFTTPIENVFEVDVNEVMVKVGVKVV